MLREAGFEEDVLEIFKDNRIDRETFIDLQSDDLLELNITALGNRKRIRRLQNSLLSCKGQLHNEPSIGRITSHVEGDSVQPRNKRTCYDNSVGSERLQLADLDHDFQYGPGEIVNIDQSLMHLHHRSTSSMESFDYSDETPHHEYADDDHQQYDTHQQSTLSIEDTSCSTNNNVSHSLHDCVCCKY